MKGRPFNNKEYRELLAKNSPRNDEFSIIRLMPLKLAVMAGLREIELTLMPINLLITPTGELHEIFKLPASIAHNGNERPVLLNEELKKDLEVYLNLLKRYHVNSMPHAAYAGFDPNASLIVNEDFKAYTTQSRGQKTTKARIVPHQLNLHLDKLIHIGSLDDVGVTRKSFIRTFVIEAYRVGNWSAEEIALMASMSKENVGAILTMDVSQYSPLLEWFDKREKRKEQRIKHLANVRRWTFSD